MANYLSIATFGGVKFGLSDVRKSFQPSTLKTNLGKTFIEKSIPLRNARDIILNITGVITGLSQTAAQTLATAIETDRLALEVLEDGYKHAYSDGRHSGDFVISIGSLDIEGSANIKQGTPRRFTMILIQWQ